ncbi:lysozyme g-like [Xenopus laevis]|uniref:Lysozyme g n=1 Tax=Xenopus laevis TaxID=8355 RepID=A0A8J1LM82_XENLA|nr:lysozyme g-like [Xenopus laevis]
MASKYGDLTKVETTGASEATAKQDKLKEKGVAASHKMAQTDNPRMQKYKAIILRAAAKAKVDPALICGIISRESRAGAVLKDGWGDHGNGFGLMQVDKRHHTLKGKWDSEEHVDQATGILVDFILGCKMKFHGWTPEQQLKGGIAAYNCGLSRVDNYAHVDMHTTGKDYSNDVVGRAQWFKQNGF